MTPPDRAKLLARIRKCLALAGSPEPHEAAAALRHAKALMDKYGLTEADVSMADIREVQTGASGSTRLAQWENELLNCIRAPFNVQVLFAHGAATGSSRVRGIDGRYRMRISRKRGHLLFVGPENRVQVAVYAYEALRRQLTRARRQHRLAFGVSGRALDTFALGWVIGVRRQIAALAAPFVLDPAIQNYIDRYYGERDNAKQRNALPRSRHELNAFEDGLAAARDAVLNPGVEGAQQGPAIPHRPGQLSHRLQQP